MTELETPRRARASVDVTRDPVIVELAQSESDAREAVAVLGEVWPRADGKEPLPSELAWVFAHSGNYVAVARAAGVAVGAAIAFRGADGDGPLLHSHIAGVLPHWQGARVGYQLKQHQRRWALAEQIDRITWTFDPLVARNAYFNVVKLGARITRYYVDFYGPMDDGINAGDETDRCLALWQLSDRAAVAAAAGEFAVTEKAEDNPATVVLRPDERGAPLTTDTRAGVRVLRVPPDIVALRQEQPDLARQWRLALRQVLGEALADGFAVVGVGRDASYVLARRADVAS